MGVHRGDTRSLDHRSCGLRGTMCLIGGDVIKVS